jgi:hypothetical protein
VGPPAGLTADKVPPATSAMCTGIRIVRATVDGDQATLRVRVEADGTSAGQAAEIMTRASDRIAAASGPAAVETASAGLPAVRTTITAQFPCAS